jgi:hypothetical protein
VRARARGCSTKRIDDGAVDADVLTHIHIPKNAGTSVRVWLVRAYPYGFGSWYPNYDFDETTLAAAGLGDARLRALSTHNIRRFPATSCGRTMRYFTLLRDPLEQFLSYVHYMKQVHAEIGDPAVAARLPPDVATISSRDFTAWLLDRPECFRQHESLQTNYLAEYAWRERAADPNDDAAYRRERRDVAKQILRSFVAVGTTERLHETLDVLRARSAAWGFALLPADVIGRENVTQTPRDDATWVGEHDAVGRALLAALAEDRALHAFAERLLDEARA